jgi:hypothetical protein
MDLSLEYTPSIVAHRRSLDHDASPSPCTGSHGHGREGPWLTGFQRIVLIQRHVDDNVVVNSSKLSAMIYDKEEGSKSNGTHIVVQHKNELRGPKNVVLDGEK